MNKLFSGAACAACLFATPIGALAVGPKPPHLAPAPPSYSYDGSGNNLRQSAWGSAGTALLRGAPSAYGDGLSTPAGQDRPLARTLSNLLSAQSKDHENNRNMSDWMYVFGQFLDHDLGLTQTGAESLPVVIPSGDPFFDPLGTGTKTMSFKRSLFDPTTGSTSPRQQTNSITAWIDGSQIYGSDPIRAAALREGTYGRLKTSRGDMMPFNTEGLPNANDSHVMPDDKLFLAGDVRANENPELVSLHTLFLREHNRLANIIEKEHPTWSDEQVFQTARTQNIAQLQAIVYEEFLPALTGRRIPGYRGYNPRLNPGIANEFSAAAFRFGHSLLDEEIGRLNSDGTPTPQGALPLRQAFFNTSVFDPDLPDHQGDIDPFVMSASRGNTQEIDLEIVDDVRSFLFGPPGSGGFDLAALNIQRGRDHGLADYNRTRMAYGLPRVRSWSNITSEKDLAGKLQDAYGSLDRIDLWVGGLAEDHLPGSSLGPTFQRIILDQFMRLRDGDRLWYQNIMRPEQARQIQNTKLSDLVKRNTSLGQLQTNLFFWR